VAGHNDGDLHACYAVQGNGWIGSNVEWIVRLPANRSGY
jgi:hypothetical protein